MTQDRKDDIKGSREIEKSRKKADLSAAVDKEKTSSAEGLPAKIVIRRLPPTWTAETFTEQISPMPDNDYFYFVSGDVSLGQHAFSRAYINLANRHDVAVFMEKFDGYVFVDSRGCEYPAVVEFAPFLKVPKKRTKKPDPRKGTIESDDDYVKFVEKLENVEPEVIPTPDVFLEEIEAREKQLKENVPVSTPLIEFMIRRREEKKVAFLQARGERKRKEMERRRLVEEQQQRRRDRERVQREKEQQKQRDRDKDRDRDKERDRDKDRDKDKQRDRDTAAAATTERVKSNDDEPAPVKLLKNPEREKEQREKSQTLDDKKSAVSSAVSERQRDSPARPAGRSHEAGSQRDRQTDKQRDSQTDRQTDSRAVRCGKNEGHEVSERGERGGASSARQKPGPYLSTNKESDDRRVRRPTNERQDERDRKAESEQSRDKQREETRLSGHGDLSRDHPRTHREGGGRARDHPQTTKEYRGYRSERRETHRDQKAVLRDDGPPRDSRTRDRDRDDDVSDDVAVRSDHTASKQASRSEEMTSQSRGAEAADRRDRDKSDVKTDKHGSGSATARQRLRYKDRPERAIYNPARRAVERQKDTASSSSSSAGLHRLQAAAAAAAAAADSIKSADANGDDGEDGN